jgi:hypothetical protein
MLVALLFVVAVALMLRPSLQQLRTSLPANLGDPVFVTYLLRWGAHAAHTSPLGYLSPTFFWPTPHVLALSDPLTPLVPVYAVFFAVTGSLATALTLTVATMLLLSLAATYSLARVLGCGRPASVLASVGFSFSGYVTGQWDHVQLECLGLIPLSLLFLFRTLTTHRIRDGVVFGITSAVLAMCSLYYGAIYAITATIIVGGWVARRWRQLSSRLAVSMVTGVTIAVGLLAPLLPAFVGSRRQLHTGRPLVPHWDLHLADLVRPPDTSLLYHSLAAALPGDHHEHQTFPGFLLYLLAAIGTAALFVAQRRPATSTLPMTRAGVTRRDQSLFLILLSISGGVALLIAAGSRVAGLPGPFVFLHAHVFGFDGIRVPARFIIIWLLAVAMLAAWGMQQLLAASRRRITDVALAALPAVVLLENAVTLQFVNLPLAPMRTGVYNLLADKPAGAVIELPIANPATHDWGTVEPLRMLYSTTDWHPRVNGYSGYSPPGYTTTVSIERAFPSEAALTRLRQLSVRWAILHIQAKTNAAGYSFATGEVMVHQLPASTPVYRATDGLLVDLRRADSVS